MRKTILFALAALTLSLPALAGPREDGMNAAARGDYNGAIQAWRPIAARDPDVQSNMGVFYLNGLGVPKNYSVALQWLTRSASAGSALGQNALGGMYRDGLGVKRDYGKALTFFAASAAQGNAGGQDNLGRMYLNGQGTRADAVHAYMWFQLAVAQGFTNAVRNRDWAGTHMTPRQVSQANDMARKCLANHYKNCA